MNMMIKETIFIFTERPKEGFIDYILNAVCDDNPFCVYFVQLGDDPVIDKQETTELQETITNKFANDRMYYVTEINASNTVDVWKSFNQTARRKNDPYNYSEFLLDVLRYPVEVVSMLEILRFGDECKE